MTIYNLQIKYFSQVEDPKNIDPSPVYQPEEWE